MIDQSTRVALYMRRYCAYKGHLSVVQASKIEATAARSYTDDADISRGALSTPHIQSRPGQSDDVVNYSRGNHTDVITNRKEDTWE
jgi:hypothetical protein